MGCVSSKKVRRSGSSDIVSLSTARTNGLRSLRKSNSSLHDKDRVEGTLEKIKEEPEKERDQESIVRDNGELGNSKPLKKGANLGRRSALSLKFGRLTQAEHAAAGWPAWLTVIAGEAVEGWLPLKSDKFERLEKIGQGTYSSVYRARDIETGKMVALKKVRFDNFKPESVRFMAREITILRRLDHPNIMKLEGIITPQLSCNIYLVFEYMEHDLAGLLSNHIKFNDAQIKCYMWQLLCGIEHCHSKGVMHRDVKTSNILVNNEGILKIADFGLANFSITNNREPLTSRVVTLWYRPPELLLGSTNYGGSVDMWSVGCVFAELFIGRPFLKGRTEVEQLHKIFKLCGTPPEEYWRWSKLPLATMFKPQHHYESTLRERCKEFPKTAVTLMESFLSLEPYKRGTASSALSSEYFSSVPYACDPSSLPKYPPNEEIDAKFHEDARRRKAGSRMREPGALRNPRKVCKPLQESTTFCKVGSRQEVEANIYVARRNNGGNTHPKGKGARESLGSLKSSYETVSEASQEDTICSLPVISASSGFAWAKSQKQDSASLRLHTEEISLSHTLSAIDRTSIMHASNNLHLNRKDNIEFSSRVHTASRGHDVIPKRAIQRQHSHLNRQDSFDSYDLHSSQDSSVDYNHQKARVRFSGPLIQPGRNVGSKVSHTRQAVHRSRSYRDV